MRMLLPRIIICSKASFAGNLLVDYILLRKCLITLLQRLHFVLLYKMN